ncbi:MAG TPA: (deoxy)nucleoside triphosphate pyrophosphohydrolase [Terriglobales bacterium]|nr:(deoxy)nucleoside triphosphate pyrophosphohydrolase [Terriglobales bacterium]
MLVVAAILRRGAAVLICQRGAGRFAGKWEFPGGKCEAGESEPEALRRELREELGIESEVGRLFARVQHRYEHGEVEIAFYEIAAFAGEPQDAATPPLFAAMEWAAPARLGTYDFLAADLPVLELLQA